MFSRLCRGLVLSRVGVAKKAPKLMAVSQRSAWSGSHHVIGLEERDDEVFACKWASYFDDPEIDGWAIRRGMCVLHGSDAIPHPKIINAALRACRRVNEYALTVRFLEAVHLKCAGDTKTWEWLVCEIQCTLDELGCNLPEDLCFDKPELALCDVHDMS